MINQIRLFCLFGFFLIAQNSFSQTIKLNLQNEAITTAFKQIENQTNYKIAYNNDILPTDKTYTLEESALTLDQAFNLLLSESDLKYEIVGKQILIVKKVFFEVFGIVQDATYNEALTAATVYVKGTNYGVTTNDYGYYSLRLLEGNHTIIVNYLGMKPQQFQIQLSERKRLNVALEPTQFGLTEIVVSESLQSEDVTNSPLNQQVILDLARKSPRVGGEPDLLHILRAKAGVQSSAGDVGGLYVRGGDTGHNLILLDGVPVYNAMHLIGMNSIFSPDAVRSVQFYTSGFSARYGGRLASVMDIQTKEGNPEKFSGVFGVNPRSVHGQFSGKLFSPKSSFWVSGRRSFIAPYVRNILKETFYPIGESTIDIKYYDFNFKINGQVGKNNRLYLSYYKGNDEIKGATIIPLNDSTNNLIESTLNFGNTIYSLRWNHIYGKHLFSNVTANISSFSNVSRNKSTLETNTFIQDSLNFLLSEILSNNQDLSVKADFDWVKNKHQIKFGAAFHLYTFIPIFGLYDESSDLPDDLDSLFNESPKSLKLRIHSAFYLEDEFNINDKLGLRLGLRYSTFWGITTPIYRNLEPRLALAAQLNENTGINLSFSKMVQYLHLASNADIGLPRDLWLPSDSLYKPAIALHYNFDLQHKFNNKWRLKSSVYYKSMKNLITLPDTITAVAYGQQVTNQLLIGEGDGYGLETGVYFKNEHWTGFGSYSLSWANRLYQNLNEDKKFPFQFDARHYLQFILSYQFNEYWQTGLRLHWSSARPYLLSDVSSLENGLSVIDVNTPGQRNSERAFSEDRIDFNILYSKKLNKVTHTFNFEIYNSLQSLNPSFYHSKDRNNISSFGFAIPLMISGGYHLEF